eukprot:6980446-Alexandrium_andersonii.AAC.1
MPRVAGPSPSVRHAPRRAPPGLGALALGSSAFAEPGPWRGPLAPLTRRRGRRSEGPAAQGRDAAPPLGSRRLFVSLSAMHA